MSIETDKVSAPGCEADERAVRDLDVRAPRSSEGRTAGTRYAVKGSFARAAEYRVKYIGSAVLVYRN